MNCVRAKWDVLRLTHHGNFVIAGDARLVPCTLEPKDNPPWPTKLRWPPQAKVKKRGKKGKRASENVNVRASASEGGLGTH